MERHTSYMLVILKHEKPIKDLPDLVADRLSKMEGVDGSGVTVATFDAVAGKDFIVRAEALEDARYRGDAVEAVEAVAAQRATPLHIGRIVMTDFDPMPTATEHPYYEKHYDDIAEPEHMVKVMNYGTPPPGMKHPTDEEKKQLRKVLDGWHKVSVENLKAEHVHALNVMTEDWTAEELDALAREWTKGIGENLI
jgi:hypothetical protein